MRFGFVVLGIGVATASVAVAKPGLLRESLISDESVVNVEASAGEPSSAAEPVASNPEQAATKSPSPSTPESRRPWPSWRDVEVVDPWREPLGATAAASTTSGSKVKDDEVATRARVSRSWARVLHEPTPRFSRASTRQSTPPAHWARPVAEIVNPWRPQPASWVPASEVIVDPWSDS